VAEQREAETAAELRSAEFEKRIAAYEFEMARAAFVGDEAAAAGEGGRRSLEVFAPISGRVLRVFQESATVIPAGARLVEVGDPSDLEVVVEALSTDAVKIAPGARVIIEHWGGTEPLAARVRVVEPAGFTKVSALGVEEQRVNVVADFTGTPASRSRIGDGFRVEARMVLWETNDTLLVPVGTLFRAGEAWAVFVARAGHAELREVNLGQRNNRSVEVLGGLQAGEQVILHPGDRIADGVRVRAR
jgi:HlyD family secretion protein